MDRETHDFYTHCAADWDASYGEAGPQGKFTLESSEGGSYGGGPTIWHAITARKPAG